MRHLEQASCSHRIACEWESMGGGSLWRICRPSLQAAWQTCRAAYRNNRESWSSFSRGPGVSATVSVSLSARCCRWWHTAHTRRLKVLCLPHCFRILHHGVISAVLNSLKKQIFHLANITQAKPYSFSRERAVWLELQESLARGRTNSSWMRVRLTRSSPYLLRGTAQFHWSSYAKSGARRAPWPLETLAPSYLLTSAAQLPSVPLSKAYPSPLRR